MPIPRGARPAQESNAAQLPGDVYGELTAWLGQPAFQGRVKGSLLLLWWLSGEEASDSALCVRMSAEDRKKGMTAYTQARQVMDLAELRCPVSVDRRQLCQDIGDTE